MGAGGSLDDHGGVSRTFTFVLQTAGGSWPADPWTRPGDPGRHPTARMAAAARTAPHQLLPRRGRGRYRLVPRRDVAGLPEERAHGSNRGRRALLWGVRPIRRARPPLRLRHPHGQPGLHPMPSSPECLFKWRNPDIAGSLPASPARPQCGNRRRTAPRHPHIRPGRAGRCRADVSGPVRTRTGRGSCGSWAAQPATSWSRTGARFRSSSRCAGASLLSRASPSAVSPTRVTRPSSASPRRSTSPAAAARSTSSTALWWRSSR